MADLGFPLGGGANNPRVPTYKFVKLSEKVHGIEIILDVGGEASPPPPQSTNEADYLDKGIQKNKIFFLYLFELLFM